VYEAEIEVCRFRVRIERVRLAAVRALIFERFGMAGEIRDAMAQLRVARATMVSDMLKEIGVVVDEVKATHVDGLEAMKLPRAELAATKQEIREIRAEFAPTSNGGPPGPLPDTQTPSPEQSKGSANSAPDVTGEAPAAAPPAPPAPDLPEPQKSWTGG
jgi:hypothetical protein